MHPKSQSSCNNIITEYGIRKCDYTAVILIPRSFQLIAYCTALAIRELSHVFSDHVAHAYERAPLARAHARAVPARRAARPKRQAAPAARYSPRPWGRAGRGKAARGWSWGSGKQGVSTARMLRACGTRREIGRGKRGLCGAIAAWPRLAARDERGHRRVAGAGEVERVAEPGPAVPGVGVEKSR
jgi:hypothetical protein